MNVDTILKNKGGDVVTIQASSTLRDAVRLLGERNIGAVVVVDGSGPCCGILSERDIVRQLAAAGTPEEYFSRPVSDCMTSDVHTCPPGAGLEEVLGMMTQRRIRHLPVVHDGALAGIISIGDVVKLKIDTAEREAEELKSYISAG